jgi:hypothetical protein
LHFCLRIDLDYVPWDTPDAAEFGHGEPAMLLKLLDLARHKGYKYHFFISNRAMRAFPATPEAILNDGHDLDWFCKHPENPEQRFTDAVTLFSLAGHVPRGMCIRDTWPPEQPHFPGIQELKFLCSRPGFCPPNLIHFPMEARSLREGIRSGLTTRTWCDSVKQLIRDNASRNRGLVVAIRPQVLAKHDPKLTSLREIIDMSFLAGLRMQTLRELI